MNTSNSSGPCRISTMLALIAGAGLTLNPAHAATVAWDANANGGGQVDGGGAWFNANQWYNGASNVNFTNGDDASFGHGGTGGAVTLSGPVTVNSLTFNNFDGTYTLGSAGQQMTTLGPVTANAGSGQGQIISPLNNGGLDLVVTGTATPPTDRTLANIRIDGVVSGAGGLTKSGPGVLWLYNTNTYTGPTTINGGVLRTREVISDAISAGNLTINSGVLEANGNETFTRNLGIGAGEVRLLSGSCGFSEYGSGTFTIRLNNSNNEVQWGGAHFQPDTLVLQTQASNTNSKVLFSNGLDLNGLPRTIDVQQGDAVTNVSAEIQGLIRNTNGGSASGITKTGAGRLVLLNGNNTYDGPTVVNGGIMQFGNGWSSAGAIPGGLTDTATGMSNLELNGGHVKAYYYIRRPLGTGPSNLQLTGGTCGFTNGQADAIDFINITNNSNYEIVWGSPFFQPTSLVLNEAYAYPAQALKIVNKIDLNGANRTIATNATGTVSNDQVKAANGFLYTTGGYLSNDIRNGSGTAGLVKEGPGVLLLDGTNTYNGGTTINDGAMIFGSKLAMPATGTVTVNDGAGLWVNLGGGDEWTTTGKGPGTVHGLLNGTGGQAGSSVIYNGDVTLGFRVSDAQTLSGPLSDLGTSLSLVLSANSGGSFTMTGNNSYSGDTTIEAGTLGVNANAANLGAGTLNFSSTYTTFPAILQSSGTYNPVIGSTDDAYWAGNGGFAGSNAPLTVTANGGATLGWSAASGFNNKVLQFGSATAAAAAEITNNITLDTNPLIYLFDNPASDADVAILSGDLVTNGASRNLTVNGGGTLVLSGTNNLGGGTLQIFGGSVVRAQHGSGLNPSDALLFNGGVLEANGTFSRTVWPLPGGVVFNSASGGFAAHGGPLTVSLSGGGKQSWSSGINGFNNKDFTLGSPTANDLVTVTNAIDLDGNRILQVDDNPFSPTDIAAISGVIANGLVTPSALTKEGTGTLLLNGTNTYTGTTTVNAGTLGGNGSVAGDVTVAVAASLAPGASVGTFNIGGNLDISAPAAGPGMLDFELDTIASSDQIAVTGTLTIGAASLGLSDFNFTNLGGLQNGIYTLITCATLSGSFDPSDTLGTLDGANIELQIDGDNIMLEVTNVPAGSPYDTWAAGPFSGTLTDSNPELDFDGGSIDTGLEWVLAGDPTDASDDTSIAPTSDNADPDFFQFTFRRSDAANNDANTTIEVEFSTAMSSWTTFVHDGVDLILIENDDAIAPGIDEVQARIRRSVFGPGGELFARLKATVTTP